MRHPMRRPPCRPQRRVLGRAALALLLGSAAAGPLAAQGLPNSLLTATVSQNFELDTNFGLDDPSLGDSYFTETRLALGLLNVTPTQTLAFGLESGLRALWEAEEDFDFTAADPTEATASYAQEWAGAALETDFRYRQREVGFRRQFDPVTDDPVDDDVDDVDDLDELAGDQIERRYDGSVELALATDAPSSYTFALDATHIGYDEENTNRTPRTTIAGDALWELRLTPVLSGALLGDFSYYNADNDAETEIRSAEVDVGVIFRPSEALRLIAGVGYGKRTEEELVDGERETVEDDSGPSLRGELRYELDEVLVDAGARVSTAAPDTRIDGTLRVRYPLPRGVVSGRVFQRYTGASNGDEVRLTGAAIGLVHDINSVSSFGLDFAAAIQENQDNPEDPDVTRYDAEAVYTYAFTDVVSADVGYRFTNRKEDPDDATSHAVFFEIGRTFQTRL